MFLKLMKTLQLSMCETPKVVAKCCIKKNNKMHKEAQY